MTTNASFIPPECPYDPRMTRAAALALRTAGALKENCVVVITDGPTIGTAGNTSITEIELNPVSPTELGQTARVHTTFDNDAWSGIYDIDLGTGTIITLTDNRNNTVVDVDSGGATIATQYPWHNPGGRFRDNYIKDSTLTGWATLPTAADSIIGNNIRNSTVNLTGMGASSSITDCVMDNQTFTVSINTLVAARSSFIDGSFTKSAAQGLTVTDSELIATTFSTSTTGAVSGGFVRRSRIVGSTVTRSGAGSGTNTWFIDDSEVLNSVVSLALGSGGLDTCYLNGSTFQITNNRGLTTTNCNFTNSTVTQNRSNSTNTDLMTGCVVEGGSTFTLNGATDAGGVGGAAHNNSRIVDGSTFTSDAPIGSGAVQLFNSEIMGGSTVALQGQNSRWLTSRAANAAIVTVGNFAITNVIVELPGAKTLTAAQTNRLANKSFDDTV